MGSLLSLPLAVYHVTARDEHLTANLIPTLQPLTPKSYASAHSLTLVPPVSTVWMDFTSPLKLATVNYVSAMEELTHVKMEVVNVL